MLSEYKITRKALCEKLLLLRCRIEDWAEVHGYDNMKNAKETWGKKGTGNEGILLWKQTDWECVDNMYNITMNGDDIQWTKPTYRVLNKMWKRYKLEKFNIKINANLEPDWEQIQQMEWHDD